MPRPGRDASADVMVAIEDALTRDPTLSSQKLRDRLLSQFGDEVVPGVRTLHNIIRDKEVVDSSALWTVTSDTVGADHIPLVMPVVKAVVENTKGLRKGVTDAEAACVVRVRLAAPGLKPWNAYLLAQLYLRRHARKESTIDLDLQLAFAPWEGGTATKTYLDAVGKGWVPAPPYFIEPAQDHISAVTPVQQRSSDWPKTNTSSEEGTPQND